jgi:hypothetical protein
MEDNDNKLRDQIAIAAMQAIITHSGNAINYIEGETEIDPNNLPRTKRIAHMAYLIADEMRKARLASFK